MSYHARVRARERYKLAVYDEDFEFISEQIADGRAEKLKKLGDSESVYRVNVQNRVCIIVYNRKAKVVITFLPPEWRKHLIEKEKERQKVERIYYRKGRKYVRGKDE